MNRFQSILVPAESEPQTDNSSHPMFYYRARSNMLENISDSILTRNRMGDVDLRRNLHVDYLARVYEKKKKQLEALQNQKNRYVPPENFKSVFDNGPSKEEIEERQQQKLEHQRQEMYNNFVLNYEVVQPVVKEAKPQIEILSVHHQLQPLSEEDQRIVRQRQNDLKLLNREINRLRQDMEEERQRGQKQEQCNNLPLIQRMSNSIISSYMIHFEEIFSLLIDDVLEDEVKYLNRLQRNAEHDYFEQTNQIGRQAALPSRKYHKLAQVFRELDQLCDDE